MPLEFSRKKSGVIRRTIKIGPYPTENAVENALGASGTGIVSLRVDDGVTVFEFDSKAAEGLTYGSRINLRSTYGVCLNVSGGGWQKVSGEIRRGNRVYINGNYLN